MANPDDDKTIINVKGMPKPVWDLARRLATQADEPMGMLLARAIQCLADQEAGRVKPPDNNITKSGNPPLTPDQLTERMKAVALLLQACAQMRQATGSAHGRTVIMRAMRHLDARQVEAEGVVPRINGRWNPVNEAGQGDQQPAELGPAQAQS